jgi:hypothetical protein
MLKLPLRNLKTCEGCFALTSLPAFSCEDGHPRVFRIAISGAHTRIKWELLKTVASGQSSRRGADLYPV